jgi:prophage antirepressor-like protein
LSSIEPQPSREFFTVTFPLAGAEFTATRQDDRLLLLGSDVTSYLEYADGRNAIKALPDQHKVSVRFSHGMPGNPNRTFLRERGVYRLAMRSNKPEAEDFQEWLAEVADQIHQALGTALDVARAERARADKAEAFQVAIEAGDGLTLRAFHKKYFSTLTEKAFMDHLYARGYLINQRRKGTQRDDGSYRDGSQHRHPAAKGKPFFYLHGHGEIGGQRRENARVRPGEPELELKARLIKDGLTANNNDTGQPRAIEAAPVLRVELEARR